MSLRISIIAITLLAVLSFPALAQKRKPGMLIGAARNQATLHYLTGLQVEVIATDGRRYKARTGCDITFEFKRLLAGTYSVVATHGAFYPRTIDSVVIREGETTYLDIMLDPLIPASKPEGYKIPMQKKHKGLSSIENILRVELYQSRPRQE